MLTGIALNLMSSGLTIFILYLLTGDKGVSTGLSSGTVPNITIPIIDGIPVVGDVLSGHSVLTYVAFLLVAVISVREQGWALIYVQRERTVILWKQQVFP